ncbi:MAG: cellulose binding domain-containing protein [Bryobacteraceae bacterium]
MVCIGGAAGSSKWLLPLALFAFVGPAAAGVVYKTASDWGSGFNGEITIVNDTGASLSGWALEFTFSRDITSIWDARIAQKAGSRYVIRSAGWNDTIEPGKSVSFGFGGAPGEVKEGPADYRLTAGSDPGPSVGSGNGGVQVAIRETGRWLDGFSASVTIQNGGAEARGWKLNLGIDVPVSGFWNSEWVREGSGYAVTATGGAAIPAGGSLVLGFTASGQIGALQNATCQWNAGACTVTVMAYSGPGQTAAILLDNETPLAPANALPMRAGANRFRLRLAGAGSPVFRAISSNPAVAVVTVEGDTLKVDALTPGRAAVRIDDQAGGASRVLGLRVDDAEGNPPGLPPWLSLGSVSEDTTDHLNFWRAIEPGARNKRVDIRYIYINGGPFNGWDTWSNEPGGRAINYIRNSRMLGMVPFFVFYNIADGGESYDTDLSHVQSASYMQAYFRNLKLLLDIIQRESPDDMVGMILEPDFLGYLAQNSGKRPAQIPAITRAAYEVGVLGGADPKFEDNVQGLVRAINYTISKYAPRVYFGWQMNLWASPAGGYTTSIPGKGLMRKSDGADFAEARAAISREAAAITQYYLEAGIAEHGARFVSIDKYGLDAGAENGAGANPAGSTWFWNADHWNNYLTFVRAMHDTSRLPIVLWQLPVGRINGTTALNPYGAGGRFPDLPNTHQRFEDSSPAYFFGDSFEASAPRLDYFGQNRAGDTGVSTSGGTVTWPPHMQEAARAGVVSILFGAGVGASTSSVGDPPTDGFWWIVKAQDYLRAPVLLAQPGLADEKIR